MSNLRNGLNRFGFAWGWIVLQKERTSPDWSNHGPTLAQHECRPESLGMMQVYEGWIWEFHCNKHWNGRWEMIDVGAAAIGSCWDGLDLLCAVSRKQHDWAAGKDQRMSWNHQREISKNAHSTHMHILIRPFNLQYKTTHKYIHFCLPIWKVSEL